MRALVKLGKKILFQLESSFRSRKNQVLELEIFKFHDAIKCPSIKQKLNYTLNNLGSKHSLLMKFGQFISYSKRNNFIKEVLQKLGPEN